MKKLLLATAAVLAMTPALAADLQSNAVIPKAPIIAPLSIWAGCYASMEAASVGGNNISGSPGAGGAMECLYQNGLFVYSAGLDMLFTKLSAPGPLTSTTTGTMELKFGAALHPGIQYGMIPLNDIFIYGGAALPATVVNSLGGSSMETGWQFKAGVATALTYTPNGLVQTSFGPEYRFTRVNGVEANTIMFVLSTRM